MINGGTGNDSLLGGAENDQIFDPAGIDTLRGGAGNDTLDDSGGGGVLLGEEGNDRLSLSGSATQSLLEGGDGDDVISLQGGSGSGASGSLILGGLGADEIVATSASLLVIDGGDGNDTISNLGRDELGWTIKGGEGDDWIEIGGSMHVIDAGAGNDTIDFEVDAFHFGTAVLTTGAGIDTIRLSMISAVDDYRSPVEITDFTAGLGGDRIDLSAVQARLETVGMAPGADPFSTGFMRLTASGGNTYVEAFYTPPVGAVRFVVLAVLQGVDPASLTADNFVQAVVPVVSANIGPVIEATRIIEVSGTAPIPLNIDVPTDVDPGTLRFDTTLSPFSGEVQYADGSPVFDNVNLSAAQLAGLVYEPVAGFQGLAGEFVYWALDAAGTQVRTSIIFRSVNTAPTVNVANVSYAANGATPFSYDLNAVVSDTDTVDNLLSFVVTVNGGALPAWLTFDPITHVLSGTAPGGTNDTYVVGVTVTDTSGLATSTTFTLAPPNASAPGTAGDDTITGTAGNDVIDGLAGHDSIDGAAGADTLIGGLGNDTLIGGTGVDSMLGGAGNDTFNVDDAFDVVVETAGGGADTLITTADYTLAAGVEVETLQLSGAATHMTGNEIDNTLIGADLDDVLDGADGNDSLTGAAGNDTLTGGTGNDTLAGGLGDDTYNVDSALDVVDEAIGAGTDTLITSANYTLAAGVEIETLQLSGTATQLTGNELNNTLVGGALDDTLDGAEGDDSIDGAGGNNSLIGGTGNDTLVGGAGNDTLSGGTSTNSLVGGQGDDSYVVDSAADVVTEAIGGGTDTLITSVNYTLTAGAEVETLQLTGTATELTGNELNNTLFGGALDDSLDGAGGNDSLIGGTGNDTLVGGADNDTLSGGTGTDSLIGGLGDDSYIVDNSADIVTEAAGLGSGADTVQSSATYTLSANVETLILTGSDAIDGTGNDLDNVLTGNEQANRLSGGAGIDTLVGGGGNDTLDGGAGSYLHLNSQGDYLSGPAVHLPVGNAPRSVDAWVRTSSTGVMQSVFEWGALNTGERFALLVTPEGRLYFSGFSVDVVGSATVTDGQWHKLSVTYNSTSLSMYVDGVLDVTATQSTPGFTPGSLANLNTAAGSTLSIGHSGVAEQLFGDVRDVVVWDRALTAQEVQDQPAVPTGGESGLVSYFTLSGTAGLTDSLHSDNSLVVHGTVDFVGQVLTGGAGDDIYVVSGTADTITENAGEGVDTVQSSASYTLGANLDNLTLTGTAASGTGNALNNLLTGNDQANTLEGGLGNDTLDGGAGIDNLTGGDGDDTYIVDNSGDIVTEAAGLGTGADTLQSSATYTLSANVETLILTGSAAIDGTGNAEANTLTGNAAANTLDGLGGNDTLIGGDGSDTYVVDSIGDVVTEQAGADAGTADTVRSSISTTLSAFVENLVLTGTAATGLGNDENNSLTGNGVANTLEGGLGNDTLDGGAGIDNLTGGDGDDTYIVDNSADIVTEAAGLGTGADTVQSSATYTLSANVETLILTGSAAIDGTGNDLDNSITGNAGNNVLDGGLGLDTLIGGAGDDTYQVDSATDVISENVGEGTDTVVASVDFTLAAEVENLVLVGAANSGTGNALDNSLIGNLGADTLDGGAGVDTFGWWARQRYLCGRQRDRCHRRELERGYGYFAKQRFYRCVGRER
ncbi:MAG: putative Ig domain-containing protein [Burkholderiales bacterium]|nr:putative Ig domain-containing protein [Burkholderiales bacterium]